MKVVDLSQRRQEKHDEKQAQAWNDAAGAIQDMKDDINVALNASIDALVQTGMSENRATVMVVSYLSDLVMGHDLDET